MYKTPLDVFDVSPQNKFEIIKYLFSHRLVSRTDAAEALGLSSVTVGKIAAAMIERGLLSAEAIRGNVGRARELLSVPKEKSVLLLSIHDPVFRATLISVDGTERIIRSYHRNYSFDYEEDLKVFFAGIYREMIDMPKDNIFGVFVAFSGEHPKSLGVNIGLLLGLEPDAIVPYDNTLGIAFAARNEKGLALHVDIDYRIYTKLFFGATCLSTNATGFVPEEKDEYSIALDLADNLAMLFRTVVPDIIAIDSEKVTADKKFNTLVMKRAMRKARLDEYSAPKVIDQKDLGILSEAALCASVTILAKRLSGLE